MSEHEFEHDPLVAGLLTGAADEAVPFIRPRGAQDVVRTVRRRRTRAIAVAAVAVVAAIATPVTALALTGGPAVNNPAGPPSISVAPPGSSAPAVPPTSDAPSGPPAPDGHISAADLRNATLQVPAWTQTYSGLCVGGNLKFSNGKYGSQGTIAIEGDPVYADVDHDGAQETVVLLACYPQGADYQVLALDRDAAGKIVTLGRVVGSAGVSGKEGTDIMTIWGVEAGDNGQVRVDVGEFRPCCEMAQASQHQWRTYGWDGTRFTQTGGPTSFGPNPKVTDLVVTADPLTMRRQPDGSYAGTLHVTIHNAGSFATPGKLQFSAVVPGNWQVQSPAGCQFKAGESPPSCTMTGLAAGADRVLTIPVTAPAGQLPADCNLHANSVTDTGAAYPDHKENRFTTVPVTTA